VLDRSTGYETWIRAVIIAGALVGCVGLLVARYLARSTTRIAGVPGWPASWP
jgi:hypothetical protein